MTAYGGLEGLLFHQIDLDPQEIAEIVLQGYELQQPHLGDNLAIIKIAPALVCSCSGEAYLTPEVSEKVDRAMREYRAGGFGKANRGG